MNSLSQQKQKIILKQGPKTENSDPEIDNDSEDNNNNTPDLSDLTDLQEPFGDEAWPTI